MRRSIVHVAAVFAVGASGLASVALSAGSAPPVSVTVAGLRGLAADGTTAAAVVSSADYATQTGIVWVPRTRKLMRSPKVATYDSSTGLTYDFAGVAVAEGVEVARPLVAWMQEFESIDTLWQKVVAWAPPKAPRVVARVGGEKESIFPLSKPLGDRGLLVFNEGLDLFRILPDGRTRIIGHLEAEDVDHGRILGWLGKRPNSPLAIGNASGRVTRKFEITRSNVDNPANVRLDGNYLLVLSTGPSGDARTRSLETRSATTGTLIHEYRAEDFPSVSSTQSFEASGGIAAITDGYRIEVARLTGSKHAYVTSVSDVTVAMEPTGVFYADNHRMRFIPRAEILARLD